MRVSKNHYAMHNGAIKTTGLRGKMELLAQHPETSSPTHFNNNNETTTTKNDRDLMIRPAQFYTEYVDKK